MALGFHQRKICSRYSGYSVEPAGVKDGVFSCVLQFVEKFSEAKEAARKAVEDRKLAGKKTEDSDKNTSSSSSSPELKSPLHQSTPISPPVPAPTAQVEGGKLPLGGMVNGDGSAARKAVNGNSQEVV